MYQRRALPFAALPVAVLLAAAVAIASGCSSGSSEAAPSPEPETVVDVPAGAVVVETAGPAGGVSQARADVVLAAVETYVRDGVVATLRGGEPGDLSSVFDPVALATLDTPEGAPLLDRGVEAPDGAVSAVAEPVVLTGLIDGSGDLVMISASLVLTVEASTADGDVTITRVVDLVFTPVGDEWLVSTYKATVFREPEAGPDDADGAQGVEGAGTPDDGDSNDPDDDDSNDGDSGGAGSEEADSEAAS